MATATVSSARRDSSTSSRRSLSRTRQIISSPGFQARTLSPSRPYQTSSTGLDESVTSIASRGRSSGSSSNGSGGVSSPPTTDDEGTAVAKKESRRVHENRGTVEQMLPMPFYPASLRAGEGKNEGGRQIEKGLPAVPVEPQVATIDEQDISTPDKWVPRDSRLVRLTGKHPFNCEARIADLFDAGFLTPSNLFYVRSHGACPKISEEQGNKWTFDVSGLVDHPCTLSIQDLVEKFEVVTLPITLVCAGNRRKEQNMIQKGLGFSWGAGGVSTALFTGVYLSDVLEYVKPQRKAKHVIFEGADVLPKGPYGTSQRLNWAQDKEKGMLLCWAMNGLPLEPDHGYPLRLVVPGQIGGRSVKWLTKLEISAEESQHYLHFWDNKVLPTELSPDQARNEEHWWYDPRYLINDLNVNSAIACPNHDEKLQVTLGATYDLKGYAYGGGGRRITRVEISLDDGATWKISEINYAEDLYRSVTAQDPVYGKIDLSDNDASFCWCFWKHTVAVEDLKNSSVVMVRAMDQGMNLQPRDMYWNPTGMMNNWYFRVAVHKEDDGSLRFEHPTMAGTQPGGWMPRMVEGGLDALKPIFTEQDAPVTAAVKKAAVTVSMVKEGVTRKITQAELEAHNKEEEPWFAVNGEVYDGTGFLAQHPGGPESITLVAGEDASEDFMAIHSSDAKKQLADYHIGTLVKEEGKSRAERPVEEDNTNDATFLNKKKWKATKLTSIERISHDSFIYQFALDRPDQPLGLPIGQHVYVRLRRKVQPSDDSAVVEGEMVQRAYTPVSRSDAKGHIDLLIKLYLPSSSFPMGGKMTCGFNELEIGDTVELKGPIGHFEYVGAGNAMIKTTKHHIKKYGLICGGSGITPILQVLRGILQDTSDTTTEIWVLDANRTIDDILCYEELNKWAEQFPTRFNLHHTLSNTPEDWKYSKGRMNVDMFKKYLPPPGDDAIALVCGSDAMCYETVKPGLQELGWNVDERLHIF